MEAPFGNFSNFVEQFLYLSDEERGRDVHDENVVIVGGKHAWWMTDSKWAEFGARNKRDHAATADRIARELYKTENPLGRAIT
jgi:hypothetical protein